MAVAGLEIRGVHCTMVHIPLRSPFRISTGDLGRAGNLGRVIVRVDTDFGSAYGEAVGLPTVTGTTAGGLLSAIESQLTPAILGHSCADIAGLHRKMASALMGHEPAKAAIDMAAFDLLGRRLDVPVATLLGGVARTRTPLTFSVGVGSGPDMAASATKAIGLGFAVAKVKIDGSIGEAERLDSVRAAIGPDVPIRLDANAGFVTAEEAERSMRPLMRSDIYMIEQPVRGHDISGMAYLRTRFDAALLADESTGTPVEVSRALLAGAADVVNIKTQSAGGLYPAMQAAAVADASGTPILIGSRMESGIGSAANVHLMSAVNRLPHPCDLKGPQTFVHDLLIKSLSIEGGMAVLAEEPGLGVQADIAAIEKYALPSPQLS